MFASTRLVIGLIALLGMTIGAAAFFAIARPVFSQERKDDDLPPRFLFDKVLPVEHFQNDKSSLRLMQARINDNMLRLMRLQFVGNWSLISFESFGQNGEVTRREMVGQIMYDLQGNMAAQLMPANSAQTAKNGRVPGYIAYFGTYQIDAVKGKVTHRPEGAVFTRWVKGELVRYFEFKENRLLLSLKNGERVTATLTWERIE